MKRASLFIGAVALAILLLAPPYWFGREIESAFRERTTSLVNGTGLNVARADFKRGWLTSKTDVLLKTPDGNLQIALQQNIEHGPLPLMRWFHGEYEWALERGRVDTQGAVTLTMPEPWSGSLAFTADSRIALNGIVRTTLDSPPARKDLANGTFVSWRGFHGTMDLDPGSHRLEVDVSAPELTHTLGNLSDIRLQSTLTDISGNNATGTFSLSVDKTSFVLGQIDRFRLNTRTAVQNDMQSFGLSYDVDSVSVAGQQYGPGRLAMEFRKLDRAALARFEKDVATLRADERPAEQVALMQFGKLLQLAGELSRKAPEFEITELRLRIGKEDIRGHAKLVLDGSKVDITKNPLLMLTTLAGNADLWLPPSLLKPLLLPILRQDLAAYRSRGLLVQDPTPQQESEILDQMLPSYLARHDFTRRLVQDGNQYRLTASLRQGQILVNGEPVSISGTNLLSRIP